MDELEVRHRGELREWLSHHHETAASQWLVTYKKHTPYYLAWDDLVSELLCWGWIDSRTRSVDADRTSVLISPRNPKSAWSAINKRKVAGLRASGEMTPAGEAVIAQAMGNGMWDFLDDVERLEVPEDLSRALGPRLTDWEKFPRSVKRGTLEWIKTAKTAPTRSKRIEDVVASLAEGLKPSPFRR